MFRRKFLAIGASLPIAAQASTEWMGMAYAGDTFINQDEAGPIFHLQGEYLGVIDAWGGTWGAQLIATGPKDLQVLLLSGGLPGDGFKGKEPSKQCGAKVSGNQGEGGNDEFHVRTDGTSLVITDTDGKKIGELAKILRESKTLGMEAPRGATQLFDRENADQFEDGKLVEGNYLGVGCRSKAAFQDHRLHLEFRTPFQPSDSGQARGNSGVYIQGRYELQVLDSFGLRGENNECGGIYQIAAPRLNMCYPPLSWQTYDVDFTAAKFGGDGKKTSNARVSIRHNGVLIHDDLELPKASPGGVSEEVKEPGPLYLQDHGNPVAYRNIWVVASKPPADAANRPRAVLNTNVIVE
jgi:hypothetical protein